MNLISLFRKFYKKTELREAPFFFYHRTVNIYWATTVISNHLLVLKLHLLPGKYKSIRQLCRIIRHPVNRLPNGVGQICPTLLKMCATFGPYAGRVENAQIHSLLIFFPILALTHKKIEKNYRGHWGHFGGRSEMSPENENPHFWQFFKKRNIYQKGIKFGRTFQISAQSLHFCAHDGI